MIANGIMYAFLIIQAAQSPPVVPTADGNGDIVVIAHRLKRVRWEFEAKNGSLTKCKIKRTSGSALADTLVCKASAQCAYERPSLADAELVPCIRDRVMQLYADR